MSTAITAAGATLAALASATAMAASPALSFSSDNSRAASEINVWSPTRLTIARESAEARDPLASLHAGAVSQQIAAGGPTGISPLYDLVTRNGDIGFASTAGFEIQATRLSTQVSTQTTDRSGQQVELRQVYNPAVSTSVLAGWSQQAYVAPTADHPAGSIGAILVGITLEGSLSGLGGEASSAGGRLSFASRTSTDPGAYSMSSAIVASPNSWSGSATVYRKIMFEYGTAFPLVLSLSTTSLVNGDAAFSGRISLLQLPLGATLDTGAQQLGWGDASALYGRVFNASSLDDLNTTWVPGTLDGGAFTVPVPEPATFATLLAGLLVLGLRRARTRAS